MPIHLRLELSGLHGKRINAVAGSSVQDLRVPLRQGQQKIGIADHSAGSKIMLAAQSNPSAEAKPAKLYVDQTGAVTAGGNEHVGLRQIGIEIKGPGDSRMPGSGHHHERFSEQPFLMNGFTGRHGNVDGEIERPARQFRFQVSAFDPRGGNRHLGRLAFQTLQQSRKDQRPDVFPERDVEIATGVGGIELVTFAKVYLQNLECLPYLVDHVAGKGSGNHVGAAAHKQGVLQKISQALQGVANGRLGEVQLMTGAGNVALAVDGFQHDEEVEIDLA